jgi:hypothetical protein
LEVDFYLLSQGDHGRNGFALDNDGIPSLKGNIMKLILDFSIITKIYMKVDKSSYCIMCIDSLLNGCNEEKCQFSIIHFKFTMPKKGPSISLPTMSDQVTLVS